MPVLTNQVLIGMTHIPSIRKHKEAYFMPNPKKKKAIKLLSLSQKGCLGGLPKKI